MSKSKRITLYAAIVVFVVLSAILTVGACIINGERSAANTELEKGYYRALCELNDSVNNLSVNLSRLTVMGGDYATGEVLCDIRVEAELAECAVEQLPLSIEESVTLSDRFNQISDWAISQAKAVNARSDLSSMREQANALYNYTTAISNNIGKVLDKGGSITARLGENRLYGGSGGAFTLSDKAHTCIDCPELIYDGAFSDGKKYHFHGLDSLADVTDADAVNIAADKLRLMDAKCLGLTSGKAEVYEIEGTVNGEDAYVSVTKKGGIIISYNTTAAVGKVNLSDEKAVALASQKAQNLGYENMTATWVNSENGIAVVTLVSKMNGILYYCDLVKIKIELGSGEMVGLEASGYCRTHRERVESPTISENTARSLVNENFTVENVALASIPDGDDETLCYELYGTLNDRRYYIYINAYNGVQERVLCVVNDCCGDMVM